MKTAYYDTIEDSTMQTYQKKPRYLFTYLKKVTELNYLPKNFIENYFMLDHHIRNHKFEAVTGFHTEELL